uniref:Uncharacterized protein n=1 Tax=Oryza sativa subsp. japonica TaxID=39947 RepID=Q69WX3_ORYSJ|nr:hypothetical protein [Oryza sativa Japonica Group]
MLKREEARVEEEDGANMVSSLTVAGGDGHQTRASGAAGVTASQPPRVARVSGDRRFALYSGACVGY